MHALSGKLLKCVYEIEITKSVEEGGGGGGERAPLSIYKTPKGEQSWRGSRFLLLLKDTISEHILLYIFFFYVQP